MGKYISSVFVFFLTSFVMAQEKEMRLSMQEAIDYAIKNNYDNKVAANDIKTAKEKKWETTTMGLPQIDGEVSYQNNLKQLFSSVDFNGDGFPDVGAKHSLNAKATLSQLIFDGSYLVGLQSAKTYLKIYEQAKEKTELATKQAIINAYGNVLVTEKTIAILESNKNTLSKTLNETQKTYENGLTELEDVEQLQITLGTIENNLSNAKRLKGIAYKMLNISLGNTINTPLILTDSLEDLTEKNTDIGLLAETFDIDNHIDYRMATNNLESQSLMLKYEKSKALPSVSGFINYGTTANSDGFTFFENNQQWFDSSLLGLTIDIPIFSSFGRRSKTAQAKIELENAAFQLENTKEKLNLQAEQVKSEYQLSIETYETAKKNLDLAERINKKQEIKFSEGISSSFDLYQSQNQLYDQQSNYIQSMMDVIAKKAELENALNIPVK